MRKRSEPDLDPESGLVRTSERLTIRDWYADPVEQLRYLSHIATYDFAVPRLRGRVLDLGCGTGYGTSRLAAHVDEIVGVDPSTEAIGYATEHFTAPNLRYEAIAPLPAPLPFDDASFDSVVSFQVIEHLTDVAQYVAEIRRVLKPGGVALIATPDRTSRLFTHQRPWNEFHLFELDGPQFRDVLTPSFETCEIHYMSAREGIDELEFRRCKQLAWVALPFTFPGAPEFWRTRGLRGLKRLQAMRAHDTAPETTADTRTEHDFDIDHIEISTRPRRSMNLIAVLGDRASSHGADNS